MDVNERQAKIILMTVDGQEVEVNPETVTKAIFDKNGVLLQTILDAITPIPITKKEYEEKVERGEITTDTKTYYYVVDDHESLNISDNVVSTSSTYSSEKILQLVAAITGSRINIKTVTIQPSDWKSGTDNHWFYVDIEIIGCSTAKLATVNVSESITDSDNFTQYQAFTTSQIKRTKLNKGENKVTIYGYGTIPTIPLTLDINIYN